MINTEMRNCTYQNKEWVEPDWNYLFWAWDLEEEWQGSLPRLTDGELLRIFPEAKAVIPEKIAEWEEVVNKLVGVMKKKIIEIWEKSNRDDQWFWREWLKATDGQELLKITRQIKRLQRLRTVSLGRIPKGGLTEEKIQQAKLVPIENLVGQQLKKAGDKLISLCPFHKEKTPSFFVYTKSNSFYCFGGCQKGGDVIDFVMLLHGFSFPEAVRWLNGI